MTKPFADFKEDLGLFCSENKVDNDKISIVGVSKKKSLEDILGLYSLYRPKISSKLFFLETPTIDILSLSTLFSLQNNLRSSLKSAKGFVISGCTLFLGEEGNQIL